jgi:SAM-dependent methyltransferase
MTRHLDIGCGGVPRNPYARSELFGVDLSVAAPNANFKAANLAIDPVPFPDGFFDSVSAYDFLEHVPRILPTADGRSTRAPFVELMNEIWRVLTPGGLFYASTPAYPHHAAFQDPTHVNIISIHTHHYFTRPTLTARMYGFVGDFEVRRVMRVKPGHLYQPLKSNFIDRLRQRRREKRGACSHLVWEFEARK